MEQAEILSLAERLIPAYHSEDFDFVLSQMTEGEAPSVKLLVKMELNRVMAPCSKIVDLRGRVNGECREYELDGVKHWLDDVAFNTYQKNVRRYGGYTEGVWEALCNTHNNFRVMKKRGQLHGDETEEKTSIFDVEAVKLGYDLKRRENRLKVSSQIEFKLGIDLVHATTIDLSPSGAKFKVPSAFDYQAGSEISVKFTELMKESELEGLTNPIKYRIIGVDESYDNDSVKFLRLLKLDESNVIEQLIDSKLSSDSQRNRHDTQDKVIRARSRGYEHTFLKHTCNLPLFFSGSELKLALMTENNQPIWHYWHDERNQQALTNLFNPKRIARILKAGEQNSSHTFYTFTHGHQEKTLFFSMMLSEAKPEVQQLFCHVGAKKDSWKVFRIHMFKLTEEESSELAQHSSELALDASTLTHCGILQELSTETCKDDYLIAPKPKLPSSAINNFRHARNPASNPACIYYDAKSRRKEPRFQFRSPLVLTGEDKQTHSGITLDISKRGISIALTSPSTLKAGETCSVNFTELDKLDKNVTLNQVPYKVIRISPGGKRLQLVILEDSHTMKNIAFFGSLIEHNQDKLNSITEVLPSNELLEDLHDILLGKIVSAPIFVEKPTRTLKPRVIGVNFPLPPYLVPLAKLGKEDKFSLEPIFKGHTNTLLAQPMKHIDGAQPQFHEIYLALTLFSNRIQSYESKLIGEFESVQQRIEFIKKAQTMGRFYAIRICSAPVFEPMSALLQEDITELAPLNMHHARTLEKEITGIVGYSEITDITEEVTLRLHLPSE
ncbi:PilZ domain-containing protein [Vibrio sp. OCN044]|uniref:PilZ domain-containing protein n=1 Tax=Vibrio tetraodonis subsp. pristinus TaxID=2695891 RepID=A0A6L8LU23_9VIBR|nr:PilZ domain-containing protein [Vibrio tetraodonis]MYM59604.1 PilZ domain-containing protein [Vibrio tetraodonis subsp. pristinus]